MQRQWIDQEWPFAESLLRGGEHGIMHSMPLVEFRNVSYDIAGKRILSQINLSVEAGETLVLLGRSGSGKSTALKLINGMLFPTAGQVLVEGRSTTGMGPDQAEASHRLCDPGRGSVSRTSLWRAISVWFPGWKVGPRRTSNAA